MSGPPTTFTINSSPSATDTLVSDTPASKRVCFDSTVSPPCLGPKTKVLGNMGGSPALTRSSSIAMSQSCYFSTDDFKTPSHDEDQFNHPPGPKTKVCGDVGGSPFLRRSSSIAIPKEGEFKTPSCSKD